MTPTIPKGMKPFDVNEAMQDVTRVRTRDGRKVLQIALMDKTKEDHCIVGVCENGLLFLWTRNGHCNVKEDTISDLFLIDDEPEKPVIRICKNGTVLIEGDLSAGVYGQ